MFTPIATYASDIRISVFNYGGPTTLARKASGKQQHSADRACKSSMCLAQDSGEKSRRSARLKGRCPDLKSGMGAKVSFFTQRRPMIVHSAEAHIAQTN